VLQRSCFCIIFEIAIKIAIDSKQWPELTAFYTKFARYNPLENGRRSGRNVKKKCDTITPKWGITSKWGITYENPKLAFSMSLTCLFKVEYMKHVCVRF